MTPPASEHAKVRRTRQPPAGGQRSAAPVAEVVLYWRPGCLFCFRLRRKLRRAGLPLREVDIWRDAAAAAAVRSVAHGAETVPTVFIGELGLVNPGPRRVLDAVRAQAPGLLSQIDDLPTNRPAPNAWWSGPLASVVVAVGWLPLASWHPNTTYHFAPLLAAAGWPITRRWRGGPPLPVGAAIAAAAGGLGVTLAATALLGARHVLPGPSLTGSGSVLVETLIAVLAGAVLGAVLAGRRVPRTTSPTPGGRR